MQENYANISDDAIKIINKAQSEIKNETGKDIILVAYPKNKNNGGNVDDKFKM